jgi:hypothetical protein
VGGEPAGFFFEEQSPGGQVQAGRGPRRPLRRPTASD